MPTLPSLSVDPSIQELSRVLRAHDLHADLQMLSVCGEPDIRLVACRDGDEVAVELLAWPADCPGPDHWNAVRVQGEDRQVWRGPLHDAPPGEVVRFVEVLLAGHAPRSPYPRLG
jgi:hypothetical protein